jgi:hypothetical protein
MIFIKGYVTIKTYYYYYLGALKTSSVRWNISTGLSKPYHFRSETVIWRNVMPGRGKVWYAVFFNLNTKVFGLSS